MTDENAKAKGDGSTFDEQFAAAVSAVPVDPVNWLKVKLGSQPTVDAVDALLHSWGIMYERTDPTASEAAALERARVIGEVREAIESEPELPGRMPCAMWDAMKFDRDLTEETLRIVVRETKKNLLDKLTELEAAK